MCEPGVGVNRDLTFPSRLQSRSLVQLASDPPRPRPTTHANLMASMGCLMDFRVPSRPPYTLLSCGYGRVWHPRRPSSLRSPRRRHTSISSPPLFLSFPGSTPVAPAVH